MQAFLSCITENFEAILLFIAEIAAYALELVGVFIIIVGSAKAFIRLFRRLNEKKSFNVIVELGEALSLALEFKMGAEIIKTVIVHTLEELAILAVVILIRALLAVIIHWEIRLRQGNVKKEADAPEASADKNETK